MAYFLWTTRYVHYVGYRVGQKVSMFAVVIPLSSAKCQSSFVSFGTYTR